MCLKHSHDRQFITRLPRLYALAQEVTAPEQAVEIIDALGEYLGYLVEPDEYDRVLTITEQISTTLNRKFMSIIEYVEKRGEARGEVRGEARGKAEGKVEGKDEKANEMASLMLQDNEPIEKVMRYTGLTKAVIASLAIEVKAAKPN